MLPSHESKLTLPQARKLIKTKGRNVSFETVWRWCRQGLKSGRVRLEYQRIGRQIVTSEGALERFFNRLAEADQIEDQHEQEIHPQHTDAEAALEAAGI